MNDHLLRQADPFQAVRAESLEGADVALLEEILATPDADLGGWRAPKERTLRGGLIRAGVAAAAITAMIAVPVVLGRGDGHSTSAGPEHSARSTQIRYAAMVKVADENPRILVTAPGWKVRDLEGFDPDTGGMRFQLGPDRWRDVTYTATGDDSMQSAHVNVAPQVQVTWYPRDQYQSYLDDRAREARVEHISVLGLPSQLVSYSDTDHAVMLPPQGKVFIEIRSTLGDDAAFKKFLADDLEQVDVDTWLAALPDAIVTSGNAAREAATMLQSIALPPGFDRAALTGDVPLDQYQFGAKVAGAVACGWLDEWVRAGAAGDGAAQQRAVHALGASRSWKVLADMNADGDYPEVLWMYADKIAAGQDPDGYQAGLGCD